MVKVRTTQLDDPGFFDKYKPEKKQRDKQKKAETDFQDTLNEGDSPMLSRKEDDEEDEKVFRRMIRLKDFDAVIPLFGIESIEKKNRFIEKPTARWQFGIVINGGIETSMRCPKVDICAWYETEELRDKRYEELMIQLDGLGIKVITI